MMTKREIVKWLESKRDRMVCECSGNAEDARNDYFKKRDSSFDTDKTVHLITDEIEHCYHLCEKWLKRATAVEGITQSPGYCGNLLRTLDMTSERVKNELLRCICDGSAEYRAITATKKDTISKIESNYNGVMRNVSNCANNKEAVAYLKSIGFDTRELEASDNVCTAMTVPIDTAYLFLGQKGDTNHDAD